MSIIHEHIDNHNVKNTERKLVLYSKYDKLTFPVSISNSKIPTLHQSAALSCPFPRMISGDMYSIVPHNEFDLVFSSYCFARPKSVNKACFVIYSRKLNINVCACVQVQMCIIRVCVCV